MSSTALLCVFGKHIISIILLITAMRMKGSPATLVVEQSRGYFLEGDINTLVIKCVVRGQTFMQQSDNLLLS